MISPVVGGKNSLAIIEVLDALIANGIHQYFRESKTFHIL